MIVCTWFWGTKYDPMYVRRLAAGVKRHLKYPHRFVVFADRFIEGVETKPILAPYKVLLDTKGCFVRLQMFSRQWQEANGIEPGERIVNIDADSVITGPLDQLFDRPESFVILQGANAHNPCPFNGALTMIRAGTHYLQDVWSSFSLEAASKVPFYEFPDDQGWIWHKLPDAKGWMVGGESGVYVYQKPGWPTDAGPDLPQGARVVTFIGKRRPELLTHLDWVKENWID